MSEEELFNALAEYIDSISPPAERIKWSRATRRFILWTRPDAEDKKLEVYAIEAFIAKYMDILKTTQYYTNIMAYILGSHVKT